jgi:hypothetical protein
MRIALNIVAGLFFLLGAVWFLQGISVLPGVAGQRDGRTSHPLLKNGRIPLNQYGLYHQVQSRECSSIRKRKADWCFMISGAVMQRLPMRRTLPDSHANLLAQEPEPSADHFLETPHNSHIPFEKRLFSRATHMEQHGNYN